ncbi:MAG: LysR family transcriptional regulator, partial [Propionicimonas sp.]
MEAHHLALLRELAVHGSVTAVAAAGHRTPSAVSQQLKVAQRALGAELVEADGRGV